MGETEGLALVLGRWLSRPGWGALRRRVGEYSHAVKAEVMKPLRLRLETPSGKFIASVEYVEGEVVFACARRTHPGKDIMLCGADLTPRDPTSSVGATEVLVVVSRRKVLSTLPLVKNNKLGELQWEIANKYAAEFGHLEPSRRAITNCYQWHFETSYYAAWGGHLKLLQWAIAHGCEWHEETSCVAAEEGNLKLLQWAIANGCAWEEWTSFYAAKHGHLKLLQWALANGCPLAPATREEAQIQGHTEMVDWLGGWS